MRVGLGQIGPAPAGSGHTAPLFIGPTIGPTRTERTLGLGRADPGLTVVGPAQEGWVYGGQAVPLSSPRSDHQRRRRLEPQRTDHDTLSVPKRDVALPTSRCATWLAIYF